MTPLTVLSEDRGVRIVSVGSTFFQTTLNGGSWDNALITMRSLAPHIFCISLLMHFAFIESTPRWTYAFGVATPDVSPMESVQSTADSLPPPALGVTRHWTNATGNSNFGTDSNWVPIGAPTALDTAVIDPAGGFAAVAGQSNTVARLVIPAGGVLVVRKADNGKYLTVLNDFVVEPGGSFTTAGYPGVNGPVLYIGGDIINDGYWNITGVGGANAGIVLTDTNQTIRGSGSLAFQNLRCTAGFTIDGTCVTYVGTYMGLPPTILNNGCFGIGYCIVATAGPNGTVSPSGSSIVSIGESRIYTITPDSAFKILDVLVDGNSVGPVAEYSFTTVAASHTIHATFGVDQKVSLTLSHNPMWNLRSVSLAPPSFDHAALYPGSIGTPFSYKSRIYTSRDTLENGDGYWVFFPTAGTDSMSGNRITGVSTIIDVPPSGRWALVGTPSVPVPISNVAVIGAATLSGDFYSYDGVYTIAATLEPGKAYWVLLLAVGNGGTATVRVE